MITIEDLINDKLQRAATKAALPTQPRQARLPRVKHDSAEEISAAKPNKEVKFNCAIKKPQHTSAVEELLKRAEELYRQPPAGRVNYTVYDATIDACKDMGLSLDPSRTLGIGKMIYRSPVNLKNAMQRMWV